MPNLLVLTDRPGSSYTKLSTGDPQKPMADGCF